LSEQCTVSGTIETETGELITIAIEGDTMDLTGTPGGEICNLTVTGILSESMTVTVTESIGDQVNGLTITSIMDENTLTDTSLG
jgi:hypothetical protein